LRVAYSGIEHPRRCSLLLQISASQFLDDVHQTEQLPQRVDSLSAQQGEAVDQLVLPNFAVHGFNRADMMAVVTPSFCAVNARLHCLDDRTGNVLSGPEVRRTTWPN